MATHLEKGELNPHVPIVQSQFKPAWWCRNPHLQTLWPLAVKPPHPKLNRERIELPDGDFIDLDWTTNKNDPVVLVIHGLEGSAHSHYARRILHTLPDKGYRGVLMHFRGSSGEPNRLPRAYHSGETGDLNYIFDLLSDRHESLHAIIAYSLGGNVLLKWLGEKQNKTLDIKAIAVSVPFVLSELADHMNKGFPRVYQRYLVKSLHKTFEAKSRIVDLHLTTEQIEKLRSFWEFDDKVTARLHGFTGAKDYYNKSSSRQFLIRINTPTLVIQAKDDPFMSSNVIPDAHELSDSVTLELTEHGGHVGFISGGTPRRPQFWIEDRIIKYLADK
ncbi:MAG: hydrolase [Acidiferrobacterales bacterium]